jgi:hypothetical protein
MQRCNDAGCKMHPDAKGCILPDFFSRAMRLLPRRISLTMAGAIEPSDNFLFFIIEYLSLPHADNSIAMYCVCKH